MSTTQRTYAHSIPHPIQTIKWTEPSVRWSGCKYLYTLITTTPNPPYCSVNRDDERQPKLISEARCICHRARGNVGALCAPIQREMPVLRRLSCDASTGKYEYIRGYHTITVGCHSVVPRQRRAHTL